MAAEKAPKPPANPKPPVGLGVAGRELWTTVHASYVLDGREVAVLRLACQTCDDCQRLEEVLETDGAQVPGSRGQNVLHPALAELRQQRALFLRLLGEINLPSPDKPPLTGGTAKARRASAAARSRWGAA